MSDIKTWADGSGRWHASVPRIRNTETAEEYEAARFQVIVDARAAIVAELDARDARSPDYYVPVILRETTRDSYIYAEI